jgi:hypothetical protein
LQTRACRKLTEEQKLDLSLRPRTLADFIGQERLKKILGMSIQATRGRGDVLALGYFFRTERNGARRQLLRCGGLQNMATDGMDLGTHLIAWRRRFRHCVKRLRGVIAKPRRWR